MSVYFVMRARKGVDLDGRESEENLRGVVGGETIIRMYGKYIFNKRKIN